MKKFSITLLTCGLLAIAAQAQKTQAINAWQPKDVSNGTVIQTISESPAEVFVLLKKLPDAQSWSVETIQQTNMRYKAMSGIKDFSRGGDGSCKVVLYSATASTTLKAVFGFNDADLAKLQ